MNLKSSFHLQVGYTWIIIFCREITRLSYEICKVCFPPIKEEFHSLLYWFCVNLTGGLADEINFVSTKVVSLISVSNLFSLYDEIGVRVCSTSGSNSTMTRFLVERKKFEVLGMMFFNIEPEVLSSWNFHL